MLTFLGDVALLDGTRKSGYEPVPPYIFNCEYVIGDSELKPIPGKINLKSKISDFEMVFGENPIAVSVANNHINDFGSQGADNTKKVLAEKGIKVIDAEPIQIGNVYLMGFMDLKTNNPEDEVILFNKEKVLSKIQNLKKTACRIVALMHWGIENDPNPTSRQTEIGHWLIDNGVDLVIGHHPHCVQKVEQYKGKYIFYSLGNGYFPPINQESHFTEMGQPTRKYRFNWRKWNRLSYVVTIDDNAQIKTVHEVYQDKSNNVYENKIIDITNLINKRRKPKIIYIIRKYWLFLVSNSFVDGKILDLHAIKAEISNG